MTARELTALNKHERHHRRPFTPEAMARLELSRFKRDLRDGRVKDSEGRRLVVIDYREAERRLLARGNE